jgi:hypothetical protein
MNRLFGWALLLSICCAWRAFCASTPSSQSCPSPDTAAYLSPSILGDVVSHGGPLLLWAPLLVHARAARCDVTRASLITALCTWLVFIQPIRLIRRLSANTFDPSGHIFVVGLQLVPLWSSARASASATTSAARHFAATVEPVLWFISGGTAAFHHSAPEVFAAFACVALAAAAERVLPHASARVSVAAALAVWLAATLCLLPRAAEMRTGGLRAKDVLRLAHDVLVAAVGAFTLAPAPQSATARYRGAAVT